MMIIVSNLIFINLYARVLVIILVTFNTPTQIKLFIYSHFISL